MEVNLVDIIGYLSADNHLGFKSDIEIYIFVTLIVEIPD